MKVLLFLYARCRASAKAQEIIRFLEIINISMQKLDVLVLAVLVVLIVIGFCFAITGACLTATDQNCRDNVAGQVTYEIVSAVI